MTTEDILCIPLVSELSDDRLVWSWDNTVFYTVKSGYRLFQSNNCTEIQPTDKILYNNIWQLQGVLFGTVDASEQDGSSYGKTFGLMETPKGPILKVNFDASFCKNTNRSNTGTVIRNGKGLVFDNGMFTPRQWDIVANLLARSGKDYEENTFWVEDGPEQIYRLIEEDRYYLHAE
ncbi:hypothetical protein J1N35_001352 [Gossypium stocksii]|uniref:Uncharacterized protein n=1 Tax=Gossypium stocksii TaxID=47602 RepID=A0A9D3WJY5_9ROSI|nr:hypothetical protein J1N35_001352 [Gossypium stocksii]